MLCAPAAFSQRSSSSFSNIAEFNLGFRPTGLAAGISPRSTIEIAVAVHDQPSIHLYELSDLAQLVSTETLSTTRPATYLASADVNNDGVSEYLTLSSDGSVCTVIRRTAQGVVSADYELAAPSSKFFITDLNNDKFKDILFYGRSSAGALTLLGRPNGTFKKGPVLFPDISISDMTATDINDDGVVDILALNWLSEELTIFMGISRLVYSEQIAIPLSSEPSEIAVARLRTDKSIKLAMTFPETREVRVYTGNALGDYRLISRVECGRNPSGISLTSLNADAYLDFVVRTTRGLEVGSGTPSGVFPPSSIFGVTNSTANWLLADVDADGNKDCVLLDGEQLLILANSNHGDKIRWPNDYAVGNDPRGLVLDDLDGDGRQDIVVANYGTGNLSFLLNQGDGKYSGQQTIALADKPTHVHRVSGLPSRDKFLIASHSGADRVTIVTLQDELRRTRTFTIPTGPTPSTMFARIDTLGLGFVVRYAGAKDRMDIFSSFKQLSSRQFIERKLRVSVPTKLLTTNLAEAASPSSYELIFAQHEKATRRTTISSSVSEKGLVFGTTKALFAYPDTSSSTKFVYGAYLNQDAFRDVIVILGPPQNSLGIWYGAVQPFSRDSIVWIQHVQPASGETFAVKDVNNDGLSDMVWLDAQRRSIVVSYGRASGYETPLNVMPAAAGMSNFKLGTLRTPDEIDLAWTNSSRGTVSVVFSPFAQHEALRNDR
ncbi:MAG: VCBS repeat-containing protein [Ignavibacteriae bacterium]|nr:VCBS repeat-containing protein [Ignavibacteriota bacterium]